MKITIEIPPAMELVAEKLDEHLRSIHGEPVIQPDGGILTPKLFPNGINDWLRLIIQKNFQKEAMNLAAQIPSLKVKTDEITTKQQEIDAMFEIATTVEGVGK